MNKRIKKRIEQNKTDMKVLNRAFKHINKARSLIEHGNDEAVQRSVLLLTMASEYLSDTYYTTEADLRNAIEYANAHKYYPR